MLRYTSSLFWCRTGIFPFVYVIFIACISALFFILYSLLIYLGIFNLIICDCTLLPFFKNIYYNTIWKFFKIQEFGFWLAYTKISLASIIIHCTNAWHLHIPCKVVEIKERSEKHVSQR